MYLTLLFFDFYYLINKLNLQIKLNRPILNMIFIYFFIKYKFEKNKLNFIILKVKLINKKYKNNKK